MGCGVAPTCGKARPSRCWSPARGRTPANPAGRPRCAPLEPLLATDQLRPRLQPPVSIVARVGDQRVQRILPSYTATGLRLPEPADSASCRPWSATQNRPGRLVAEAVAGPRARPLRP